MKRFTVFFLTLAIALALPFTIKVHAKEWPKVGANPTTTSVVSTLQKMDVDPSSITFVQYNFPETTHVVAGTVFNEVSEGNGVIKRNVKVTFENSPALVWHAGDVDVYYVLYCNNVAWKAACPQTATPEIITPAIQTPVKKSNVEFLPGFPDWFKSVLKFLFGLLLLLLLLLALYWILRGFGAVGSSRNNSTPPTNPNPGGYEIREVHIIPIRVVDPSAAAPANPTAEASPAPSPATPAQQPDRLAELTQTLKDLLEQRKVLDEKIDNVKADLRTEVEARKGSLDEIEQLLK